MRFRSRRSSPCASIASPATSSAPPTSSTCGPDALPPFPSIPQGPCMKISRIQLAMLRVPLKTPFKTALRTVEAVEDVVVIITTDTGQVGYGEAPATAVITGDTHGSIIEAIRK